MTFKRRPPIKDQSLLSRTQGISSSHTAEGLFLVDAHGGRLYELNATGRAIWEGLEQPIRLNELSKKLMSEFCVDEETVRKDVIDLLDEFRCAKLIGVNE